MWLSYQKCNYDETAAIALCNPEHRHRKFRNLEISIKTHLAQCNDLQVQIHKIKKWVEKHVWPYFPGYKQGKK